jgi:hypothetical protein
MPRRVTNEAVVPTDRLHCDQTGGFGSKRDRMSQASDANVRSESRTVSAEHDRHGGKCRSWACSARLKLFTIGNAIWGAPLETTSADTEAVLHVFRDENQRFL